MRMRIVENDGPGRSGGSHQRWEQFLISFATMILRSRMRTTTMNARRARRVLAAGALTAVVLAGCGSDDSPGATAEPSGVATGGADPGQLAVVAGFYPLQFVAERVGGDAVVVTNLTPAGAEPHDLELTGRDTAQLQDAELVVYLSGFSPALDEGVEVVGGDHGLDVASAARLDLDGPEDEHATEHTTAHAAETATSHEDDDDHDDGLDHADRDPHFWLDPTRLADVADAVAARLAELDPDRAGEFTQRASSLRGELEALDAELEAGLARCESTDVVTSHAAFGYLAQRYGLTQVGISGLSPEEEPSPARLAEVAEFATEHDVSTIYYETLVDPSVAEAVAAETGAEAAVLDPIEGLTDGSAGSDYFEVMRSNLQSLRNGQNCT